MSVPINARSGLVSARSSSAQILGHPVDALALLFGFLCAMLQPVVPDVDKGFEQLGWQRLPARQWVVLARLFASGRIVGVADLLEVNAACHRRVSSTEVTSRWRYPWVD